MKKLMKYLKGYGLVFTLAILSIVLATVMQLAVPILIKYAIDSIVGDVPAGNLQFLMDAFGKSLWGVVWIIVIMSLFRGIFMFLKGYLSSYAAENIAKEIREKLYRQIQYMTFERNTRK